MKPTSTLKYSFLTIVILGIFFVASGICQDEDEDEEDAYDEELGDETTTTRRSRRSTTTTTVASAASGRNNSQTVNGSTVRTATSVEATTRVSAATPASAPAPVSTRTTTIGTTTSEYEDDEYEATTEEEGYGYVFRPLNKLIDNIVAGNVSGIVDNALSIRTPPEVRAFVNNVMSNIFSSGVGSALKQFMPQLFSTQATPTLSPGRDPIPTQTPPVQVLVQQQPIPISIQPVLTARTNGSDEVKSAKNQQPLQLAFTHPGAPASRLRCEVIM